MKLKRTQINIIVAESSATPRKKEDIMTEISKNPLNIPQSTQTQKTEQVKNDVPADVAQPEAADAPKKEIKEIPENPADRSTVKVDNLENDIKVFVSNPELAEKALEIAELAEKRYEDAGLDDPELRALAVGKAFVEEFQK